jgi:hypothetical protein
MMDFLKSYSPSNICMQGEGERSWLFALLTSQPIWREQFLNPMARSLSFSGSFTRQAKSYALVQFPDEIMKQVCGGISLPLFRFPILYC